jgi:hypothetical protein
MSHGTPDPRAAHDDDVNPDVRFEHKDANPAVIAKWALGLALVTIVTATVAVWLLVFLRRHEEAGDPHRPALYFANERRAPEGVRLQSAPFQDLSVLRAQEAQFLQHYGWVDRTAGVVHIPVEEAMRLYVERQAQAAAAASAAPVASAASAAAAEGVPTDSAPVPSPRAVMGTPLPVPAPSPAASGPPAPPAPRGPTGAHP